MAIAVVLCDSLHSRIIFKLFWKVCVLQFKGQRLQDASVPNLLSKIPRLESNINSCHNLLDFDILISGLKKEIRIQSLLGLERLEVRDCVCSAKLRRCSRSVC